MDFGLPLVYEGEEFNIFKFKDKSIEELKALRILPNIQGIYRSDSQNNTLLAIILSHSHLDHYGLFSYLKDEIPIYLSEGTKRMIGVSSLFTSYKIELQNIHIVKSSQEFIVGNFRIIPYDVGHSAFNALAFLIEAEGIRIFYTGDFRRHGRKKGAIELIVKKYSNKIDYLVIEGSMLGRNTPPYKNESDVEAITLDLMKKTEGLVLLMFSVQNIDRLVSLYKATLRADRLFVVDVYAAFLLDTIRDMGKIPNTDWKKVRVFYPKKLSKFLLKKRRKDILDRYRGKHVNLKFIQSSQNRLSLVFRNSMITDLREIDNLRKSLLIYSMYEGYLKKPEFQELFNFLKEKGIRLEKVHVSGHAYIEDLKGFADALNPKQIIPIHTFYPEKYHELFGNKIKTIRDNGTINL